MFRRRRYRRRRNIRPSIIHVPSEIGISITANNSNAGNVMATPGIVAGAPATTNVFSSGDRDQIVLVGSKLSTMIMDLTVRGTVEAASGVVEYAVFKVERATTTPTSGGGQLPTAAEILADGMQNQARMHNPGRVIKFGVIAFAGQQPVTRTLKLSWGRFKLAGVRAGDYYMIHFFSRGAASEIDYHCRYKEYK